MQVRGRQCKLTSVGSCFDERRVVVRGGGHGEGMESMGMQAMQNRARVFSSVSRENDGLCVNQSLEARRRAREVEQATQRRRECGVRDSGEQEGEALG